MHGETTEFPVQAGEGVDYQKMAEKKYQHLDKFQARVAFESVADELKELGDADVPRKHALEAEYEVLASLAGGV